MHPLLAEWLPVSIAPSDGDNLEVCVLDYDGIVHALVFPCRKDGAAWSVMLDIIINLLYRQSCKASLSTISEAPLGLMGTFSIPEVSRA
jgi:hypothetical protein